jgi:hypothetical protein
MIPEPNKHSRFMSSLPARVAAALAVPWQTSYVAPTLMALTGVAYALRGYEVLWTRPQMLGDTPADAERDPAKIIYSTFAIRHGERTPVGGVELSCVFPRAVVMAEYRARAGAMSMQCRFRAARAK